MVGESQGTWVSECFANPAILVKFLLGPGEDGLLELRVRPRMQGEVRSKAGEVSCRVKWGVTSMSGPSYCTASFLQSMSPFPNLSHLLTDKAESAS